MNVLNKKICGLLAALLLLAPAAHAAGRVKLTIQSSPQSPAVKVWIDGKEMGETPLEIPGILEGRHVIRVSRQGGAFERTVLFKSGPEVILVANFLTNDFVVKNRADLKYEPLQVKKTTVMITSSQLTPTPTSPVTSAPGPAPATAPAAPAAPEKAAPQPAPIAPAPIAPAPVAPAPKPSAQKPPEQAAPQPPASPPEEPGEEMEGETSGPAATPVPECEPGQWCAAPAEGEMGPPVPPDVRKNLELRQQEEDRKQAELAAEQAAEQARQKAADEARLQAEPEPKKPAETTAAPAAAGPEKKPAPPCAPRPGAACASFGSDVRGVVNTYYCSLAHHDFERAYKLWSTTHDLAWFLNVGKSFCAVYDYRIEGFQAANTDEDKAEATYVVSLLDQNGAAIESWNMRAILIKQGGQWKIRSVSGKPTK